MLRSIWHRLRLLWRKQEVEQEMDEELRFHLDMEIEQNIRRGMSRQAARTMALRNFGGVEQTKERCRDIRGFSFINTIWQDIRFGLRLLVKYPGFTFVAVLTLALGIGANSAIFSVVNGALLRPLPYREGDRLVVLHQQAPLMHAEKVLFSVKEIEDYRAQNHTLADLVEYHSMTFTLLGRSEPERVQTGVVSANFFDVMGVKPILGRTFIAGEDKLGAEPVLLLSYEYWQRSHGGDPQIVGKTFKMNDRVHTVIGVLPPIPQYPNENDVYMPTSACPFRSSEQMLTNRNARMMSVFGRLKPGVSVEQANSDIRIISDHLKNQYPEFYPANTGYYADIAPLQEDLTRQARPTFLILLAMAGLVLLIACANVANLALARLINREREMAIRAALGAGRGRLIRQLLTESTLMALAGGALGLLFASGGLKLLVAFAARFTTRASEISIDGPVLIFTIVVSIITGVAFGLLPAFYTEESLNATLKDNGRATVGGGKQKLRGIFIISQVAVSFMLLIGAGLVLRSFIKLQQVNLGFNPDRVLTLRVNLNWSKYTSPEKLRGFYNRLLTDLKLKPELLSVAVASTYPLDPAGIKNGPNDVSFQIEGRALNKGELAPLADLRSVSPDYFQTIGLPLLQGRLFTPHDDENALAVAVINSSMAKHRWNGEDPIGKRITGDSGKHWVTIIGVVGDVKQYGPGRDIMDEIYRPFAQETNDGYLLARTLADPKEVAQQLRNAIYQIDSETAVTKALTLEEARDETMASPRLTTILLGLFAMLALIITLTGISGVMALMVSQRTHEIGIRMALGATQGNVLMMLLRQGMKLVLIGLAIGCAGAVALTKLMTTLLFAVAPTDPITFVAASIALSLVAAIACLLPARRATSINPVIALRAD